MCIQRGVNDKINSKEILKYGVYNGRNDEFDGGGDKIGES